MKNIKICFFGTYDRSFSSNALVLRGLLENKTSVLEVNSEVKITKLTKKDELSMWELTKRVLRKHRLVSEIWNKRNEIKNTDVIYVGYPGHFDVIPAWIVAKIFKKKLVFNPTLIFYVGFSEEQGILDKKSFLGKLIKYGEMFIYKLCDMVFADTPFQRNFLIKEFGLNPKKVKSLPLGADDIYYRYTPYKNTTSKNINVTYYGLYSPIHGVECIIEAARILRNDSDIHFTMIGNGNTFQQNFDRAQKLELTNITFHHDVPFEKHPAIMEKADIFLGFLADHPSIYKVIANKVYQGLALGKVVVGADAPVMRSVFTHKENIYLCKPNDPKDFVKALVELKNNPKLRTTIAVNGYRLFEKQFTPKKVVLQMMKYVEEIL